MTTAAVAPFPLVLDSTMLSAAGSCHHKFLREHVENWKPLGQSVHLHAGAAFAKGLETAREAFFVKGLPAADAEALGVGALLTHYGDFPCPADSAKSAARMAGALEFYFSNYPLGRCGANPVTLPSGKLGIEIGFAEPLPVTHPETDEPLIYSGRLDMACDYAGGLFVEDDKTTSSLGATWAKQWDLRSQFTGYCWGMWKCAGIKPNGVLVRGVSILKTKYETQQAITYRADWQIEEWLEKTCYLLEDLKRAWKNRYWRKNLDHACNEYGGCGFRATCMSQSPRNFLLTYFERRHWDPITRTETKLPAELPA